MHELYPILGLNNRNKLATMLNPKIIFLDLVK